MIQGSALRRVTGGLRSEIDDTLPVSWLFRCELRGRGLRSEIDATLPVSGLFRSHPAVGFDQESDDTLPYLGLFGAGRLRVTYRDVK